MQVKSPWRLARAFAIAGLNQRRRYEQMLGFADNRGQWLIDAIRILPVPLGLPDSSKEGSGNRQLAAVGPGDRRQWLAGRMAAAFSLMRQRGNYRHGQRMILAPTVNRR